MFRPSLKDSEFSIGAVAGKTGFTVATIRYYEEIGLIPPATRRLSGHRSYGAAAQASLQLIKELRSLGFPIEKTRALVALAARSDADCSQMHAIAASHLEEVRAKVAELRDFEQRLSAIVVTCSATCANGPASKCTIVRDITSHEPAQTSCCG